MIQTMSNLEQRWVGPRCVNGSRSRTRSCWSHFGSADQGVVWRSTVGKFSRAGSGFDSSFSKTEKVRVVGMDQIR